MQALDILKATGGVEAIASQLGIPPAMAQMGAEALLPAILGGFSKKAPAAERSSPGLGGLGSILEGLGGAGLADNVLGNDPTNIDQGNSVLGEIFGSKDVSRSVAGHAAEGTGIDASVLKKMLPVLAMLVTGYLSSGGGTSASSGQSSGGAGGMLGSILGSVLGGGKSAGAVGGSTLGSIANMLDFDGDGNPLDDIMGMAGKFLK